jgi:hypothetical protein
MGTPPPTIRKLSGYGLVFVIGCAALVAADFAAEKVLISLRFSGYGPGTAELSFWVVLVAIFGGACVVLRRWWPT